MAWEERNGNRYYYQAERDESGRVRKRYIGSGEVAELIAHADATRQRVRQKRREEDREELERMRSLMSQALDLDEAVEVLVRAQLVAGGLHRHKGEWRRGRKKKRNTSTT
jgi:hypothetical protein